MGSPSEGPAQPLTFSPTLIPAAHVACDLAHRHCANAIGGDCTWYHSAWLYLRALGVVKSAGGHAAFLHDQLTAVARNRGAQRVLVSGAADDATVLIAIGAFRDASTPLDLTLIDRCETPLALSRWSAGHAESSLQTHHTDVLGFEARPFDVIIANSFLAFVHETHRPGLFARWSALLEPGGVLLLTNRLRPGAAAAGVGFTAQQADRFFAEAAAQATQHRAQLGIDPAVLERMAHEYARRLRGFPLGTVEELETLLANAGFSIAEIDVAVAGAKDHAISGPASAEAGRYVRLLARRL